MVQLTQILSIVNMIILIGIPILMWYLNKKTTKEIEKLKIRDDLKFQNYRQLFDMFNSILTKEGDSSWTPKNRIDLTVNLLKYAPDEIIVRQDLGYVNTKINSDDV